MRSTPSQIVPLIATEEAEKTALALGTKMSIQGSCFSIDSSAQPSLPATSDAQISTVAESDRASSTSTD